VSAALIKVDWRGEIISSVFPGVVDAGDAIAGSYLYDSESPPLSSFSRPAPEIGGVTGWAKYPIFTQPGFSLNDIHATATDGAITIEDNAVGCLAAGACLGADAVRTRATSFPGVFIGGLAIKGFSVALVRVRFRGSNDVLHDTNLPATNFSIDDWRGGAQLLSDGSIALSGSDGRTLWLSFQVNHYEHTIVAPVPAPGTLALVGLAFLGLVGRRYRRIEWV